MVTVEQKASPTGSSSTNVVQPEKPRFEPEKDLYVWKAASRPIKKRGREYWVTIFSIAALLAFVLFLAEGVMPVILIVSLVFLYFVLSTVNPEEIEYKITNRGVRIADKTTSWGLLTQYWFSKRMGSDILTFGTFNFPGRFELVIPEKDIQKVKEVLQKYLPEETPVPTSIDKATSWLSKKLPDN
jgi:hypothetical protein